MGWPDSPPSNMRCCGGDKKDSRPLVPGPQLPGKLHAALASHTDVQTEQVEPRPLPHRGFHDEEVLYYVSNNYDVYNNTICTTNPYYNKR